MTEADKRVSERILRMRTFIDARFPDGANTIRNAAEMRASAHEALNYLLAGDVINGDKCIRKLDLRAAVDMRRRLGELDLMPKKQGQRLQD